MDGQGTIAVDHVLPELTQMLGSRAGGQHHRQVSARSKILRLRHWNAWDNVVTGADGGSRSPMKGSDRRQFKVQILFDSSKLPDQGGESQLSSGPTAFPSTSDLDLTDEDWHEVYATRTRCERQAGVHDLGTSSSPPRWSGSTPTRGSSTTRSSI
jgi:hypothetical protein